MSRVTKYLEDIGTEVNITKKDYLPLMIHGNENLLPVTHHIQKASAQIKSALILASLNIHGKTKIVEKTLTRDHTERMMKYLNINFKIKKLNNGSRIIELNGPYEINSKDIEVVSDPSSASFFIVGALIAPGSKVMLKKYNDESNSNCVLKNIKENGRKDKNKKTKNISGEEVGSITAEYSKLKGVNIPSKLSAMLIDEYPILSIAACQAKGKTVMKGLDELRHKESDRINSIVTNFKKIGFKITNKKNDLIIYGKDIKIKKNIKIKTFDDHRIAMSFSILNIIYDNYLNIDNKDCISISYPHFEKHLNSLTVKTNG